MHGGPVAEVDRRSVDPYKDLVVGDGRLLEARDLEKPIIADDEVLDRVRAALGQHRRSP